MKIQQTDVTCGKCRKAFVVECLVESSDKGDRQVVACPDPACNAVNHPILVGEQVNWFMLRPEIQAIRSWQANTHVHPLTCGNDSGHDVLLASTGDADELILVCPDCDYRQIYIPAAVLLVPPVTKT